MLESRVIYNGISYKAKRDYIYCFNRDADAYSDPHKVRKFRLDDADKKRIKAFCFNPYDDMAEFNLLNDIWSKHEDRWEPYCGALPSTPSEYYK